MEWQYTTRNTYTIGHNICINNGDTESLDIWIGIRDDIFGEDGIFWEGKDMGQLYWEILVKDNLYIPS